jgi:hypothetical protein
MRPGLFSLLTKHAQDLIAGGKAHGMRPDSFDKTQIAIGAKVEREHTPNPLIAREIAMDHLVEKKDYYKILQRAGLADELEKKAQQILSKLQPSKDHQEFLDNHFTDSSTSKWKAFKNKLVSSKFVDAVKQDERADSKLKRYSENNARHMQAKGVPIYPVPSQSSGRSYTVKYHPSVGRFSCNCGDWVHKQSTKGKGGECKHVKMVKRELQAQGIPKEKQAELRGRAAASFLQELLAG